MKIKNWDKFQHFKNRKPPWIKLYRDLLDDMEWHTLDPKSAKILVMLWLLASEDADGTIPEIKIIAFRVRMSEKDVKSALYKLEHWIDISMISERYQSDPPEREEETETETETEKIQGGKHEKCPYTKIASLYHDVLPKLRRIRDLTPARKASIRARWQNELPDLETWGKYFNKVSKSKFLMGQIDAHNGRRPFQADIDWLIKAGNIVKVSEGKYHG